MSNLKNQIDFLIIDEATQSTEVASLVPLVLEPKKLILIGDPKQLTATTYHKLAK